MKNKIFDSSLLSTFVSEQQNTMRQRVDNEWKFLTTFFILVPVLLTLFLSVLKYIPSNLVKIISIVFSVFLFFLTYFIIHKIIKDHEIYDKAHTSVKKVYELLNYNKKDFYISKDSILTDEYIKSKSGKGFIYSIIIIIIVGVFGITFFLFPLFYSKNLVMNNKIKIEKTNSNELNIDIQYDEINIKLNEQLK